MYSVRAQDTIYDAAFNVGGSLATVDPLLEMNTPTDNPMLGIDTMRVALEPPASNFMESWTPALFEGQLLETEGIVVHNLEAIRKGNYNSTMCDYSEVMNELGTLERMLNTVELGYLLMEDGNYVATEDGLDIITIPIPV